MRPRLDPELGVIASAKKDDDLYTKGSKASKSSVGWKSKLNTRIPPRKTLRRLGLLLLIGIAAFVFIHNIPTDLGPRDRRRPVYVHPSGAAPLEAQGFPKFQVPDHEAAGKGEYVPQSTSEYDGPLRFLELAESLHGISGTKGTQMLNKNVLFIAGSLKSADSLLPIACQMGKELRSYVHFALVSRNEIPLQQLREINGIDDSCNILFHDARPDFASKSSDERYYKSAGRALYHINNYMHPQAILVDASDIEERSFIAALKQQMAKQSLQAPIIELPSHAEEHLSWITKLDASSLLQWSKISVEILVQAHAGASGSLIRLLKSLSAADFSACAIPHLTIELPEDIDPSTALWLQNFQWPPRSGREPSTTSQLTLRRRISRRGLTEEESSARFLESFWPTNYLYNHVLVLSPQAELSPNFLHYLKMMILEYRYSSQAISQSWGNRLFGLSLDLPSSTLGGQKRLATPGDGSTPFLWQAPNSNAALFTGEKWVELHNFVSQILDVQHKSSGATIPALLADKLVSKNHPAWIEHALRLCQARGYLTIYPSANLASNLATIHTDLYRQPEEYENDGIHNAKTKQDHSLVGDDQNDYNNEEEIVIRSEALLKSLPNDGNLLRPDEMPLLAWDGTATTFGELDTAASKYAVEFRQSVGGCVHEEESKSEPSLFCTGDVGI